jgi:phosphocarrier protein FPr/phosphocarrier protein
VKAASTPVAGQELLVLHAPMSGWAAPLDEAPDPVFAGRMLGDGVALDPVSETLHAPCDGVILLLPKTRHAVTLRADNGAEILLHVGLETVALGGEGFEAHVAEGQRVRRGERLLSFDLDLLAGRARSLLTPVVVTNGEAFEIVERVTGREVVQDEPLMTLRATGGAAEGPRADGDVVEAELTVGLAHGLHARPAARLAACAQGFAAEVELSTGARQANLRSAISVMALGAAHGQALRMTARGAEALAAVAALEALLATMAAEEPAEAVAPPPLTEAAAEHAPGVLRGVTAAPGLAIGVAVRLSAPEPVVIETSAGAAAETEALAAALSQVDARLREQAAGGDRSRGDILAAHQAFLADADLRAAAEAAIAGGASAGVAWRGAVRAMAEVLRGLDDPLFAERADDLLDLEHQVLFALSGEAAPAQRLPGGAIVIADELLPSQLIALDGVHVAGFCTARGGATSHVAILAASRGAPALAAMGPELLRVADGTAVILDADAGVLRVAPDGATFEAAQGELARRAARRRADREPALEPCRMADGTRVEVFANLGAVAEAAAALGEGAEGCGLFRTEFLYLDRQDPPGEDEQAAVYQAMAEALQGRPLVVRTLDAGGDKPLAFLPTPPETNPALGLRGIRAGLRQPDLLSAQLRGILRVRASGERRILLPMVCDLADLRAARGLLEAAAADLSDAGPPVRLGVMVETPAAALLADQLAAEADFLSIGTNDLAQYVLAIDREHPDLAARLDALHPAVLRLIDQVARLAAASGCPVSVCGGLASDPLAAPLLVGLGVRGLSAAPAAIPGLKAQLRARTLDACQAAARQALDLTSAEAVRSLLRERFPRPDGATP